MSDDLVQDALDAVGTAKGEVVTAQAALGLAMTALEDTEDILAKHQQAQLPDVSNIPLVTPKRSQDVVNVIGVCAHVESAPYSTNLDKVIALIKELGLTRIRCRIYRNNTAQRDAMTRIFTETGASFVSNLGQPGGPTPTEMVKWLTTFTAGVVRAAEGPNEPNLQQGGTWAADTRKWMTDLKAALKLSTNPAWVRNMPILAPALGARTGFAELGTIAEANFGNLHVYQGGGYADFRLDDMVKSQQACTGTKPCWVTETGYHNAMNNTNTHIPTSEKAAASYIPKVVLENFIRSTVQAAYIYELVDNPDNPAGTDQEAHFGLVRSDWSKKPAYVALALMLNALKDSGAQTFTLNPIQMEVKGPPDMKTVLLARSDGSYQLVAWRTVEVWDRQGQKDIPCTDVEVGVRFAKKATGSGIGKPARTMKVGEWAMSTLGAEVKVVTFKLEG